MIDAPAISDPVDAPDLAPPPSPRGLGAVGLWARVGLAVALLAASAAGRAWQAGRVDQMLRDGRVAPFPLAEIPLEIGAWTGQDEAMDPIIARATGSTDHLNRVYQNTVTGQKVAVIVLFGPSEEMFIHAPEVCYPASGYTCDYGPIGREIARPQQGEATDPWRFHELVYVKGDGGQTERQDVFYTWRYNEAWTPALTNRKGFERIPGMFKVQVSRPMKHTEVGMLDVGNPCESFLALLMPEIDRRIAEARAGQAAAGRAGSTR